VVENFGCNSRVTFPFQRIEELRDVPDAERDIAGKVTYANILFPNVLIAVLSNHTVMSISEPLSPSRTHLINYRLTNHQFDGSEAHLEAAKYDAAFVAETGAAEDLEMTRSIQAGLDSKANTHFTYGYYEKAIVHFHKNLAEMIRKIEEG
jgi:choline monooxygenase